MGKFFFHFTYACFNILLVLVLIGMTSGAGDWASLPLEAPDGDWVMLPQPLDFEVPQGPAIPPQPSLRELPPPPGDLPRAVVINGLPTRDKVIALTIDDSPSWHTETLLAILKDKAAPATFFMDGSRSAASPGRVQMIAQAGHDIANHTWSHPFLTQLTIEEVRQEISRAEAALKRAGADYRPWLRPPYGDHNAWVRVIAGELNHKIIMWNLDSLDWRFNSPQAILDRLLKGLRPGAIILIHDGPRVTPQMLPQFIDEARALGYEFVLISDYID